MGDISKDFNRHEFLCKCGACSCDTVDAELLQVLQQLRDFKKKKVYVLSGHRCADHNRMVGGATNSYHLKGQAVDFIVIGEDIDNVYDYLNRTYKNKYGLILYLNSGFIHLDIRKNKYRAINN